VAAAALAALLALTMVPAVAFAAPADSFEFYVGEPLEGVPVEGLEAGDVITIPIKMAGNPGVSSVTLITVFDTSVFEYVPGTLDYSTTGENPSVFSNWMLLGSEDRASEGYLAAGGIYVPGLMYIDFTTEAGIVYKLQLKVKDGITTGNTSIGLFTAYSDTGDPVIPPFSSPTKDIANAAGVKVPCTITSLVLPVKGDDNPLPPAAVTVGSVVGTVKPGDSFTVPISIAQNPGFAAFAFTLGFNSSVLELTALDATGALLGADLLVDLNTATAGYVKGAVNQIYVIDDDGVLYYATFTVKAGAADGTYPISIGLKDSSELNFVDSMANPLDIGFNAGSVKVETPLPPPAAAVSVGSVAGTVKPGDSFTVPISIAQNPGFAAFAFTLGFDSSALELTALDATGALLGADLLADLNTATAGYVKGAVNQIYVIDDDGVLYNATFTVKAGAADGTYPISIGLKDSSELNFVDSMANPLDIGFTAGSVVVKTPPPDPTGTVVTVADSAKVRPGDTFTLPVSIKNNTGYAAFSLQVDFDSTYLELIAIDNVNALPGFNVNLAEGKVGMFSSADITSNDDLFNLVFKVKAGTLDGNYAIGISIIGNHPLNFANADWVGLDVTFVDGTVGVSTTVPLRIPEDLDLDPVGIDTTDPSNIIWERVYNGSLQVVSIGLAAGITGTVTVYYDGSLIAPSEVGEYDITITAIGVAGHDDITTPEFVGTLRITKATAPTITWPTAADITYGQTIGDATLSFITNAYGSFAWDSSVVLSTEPDVGTYNYPVVFTPNAGTLKNYAAISPLTQNVQVVVNKAAAPTITWPTAANITYGQTVGEATLSFTSDAYGSFAWAVTVNQSAKPDAGTYYYPVVFTPSAGTLQNYAAISPLTQDVQVVVNKAPSLTVSWPTASTIRQGQVLADSSLSFAYNEYGMYNWAAPGTAPLATGGTYIVNFTPFSWTLNNYETITTTFQGVYVKVMLPGDVDGDSIVTAVDAMRILQHVLGIITLTGDELIAADVDGDGTITATDAVRASQISIGL
jgi:hypothetical protein